MSSSETQNGANLLVAAVPGSAENSEMIQYTKCALNVVTFRIVHDERDLETTARKSNSFHPEMTHQIFGSSEMIFGYRDVSINLYYLHNSARCYVKVDLSGLVPESETYKPDDIMEALQVWLPSGFRTEKSDFLTDIENESHSTMFGEVIHTFEGAMGKKYKITLCDTNDQQFRLFHERFETYIIWFIDGANFIDLDDKRWLIYYVYEENFNETTKTTQVSPIGFCTVYKFFLYPNSTRARISQFFILPTHQRKGIATKLYSAVFDHLKTVPEVRDITVEEPTEVFQKIRDYCDSLSIHKYLEEKGINITTRHQKQINQLLKEHKICKRQAQRVFDILECMISHKNGYQEYVKFTENIKSRIVNTFERENRGSKRICNSGKIVPVDPVHKKTIIEGAYSKYIDSLEWPVNRLRNQVSSK